MLTTDAYKHSVLGQAERRCDDQEDVCEAEEDGDGERGVER